MAAITQRMQRLPRRRNMPRVKLRFDGGPVEGGKAVSGFRARSPSIAGPDSMRFPQDLQHANMRLYATSRKDQFGCFKRAEERADQYDVNTGTTQFRRQFCAGGSRLCAAVVVERRIEEARVKQLRFRQTGLVGDGRAMAEKVYVHADCGPSCRGLGGD